MVTKPPNVISSGLSPEHEAVIDRHADAFSKEIESWHLDKQHYAQTPPLSDAMRRMLVVGFYEIVFAVVAANEGKKPKGFLRRKKITETQWEYAQAGAAAQMLNHIMACDDIRKHPGDVEEKRFLALKLGGGVIFSALLACDQIGQNGEVNKKLFNLPTQTLNAIS